MSRLFKAYFEELQDIGDAQVLLDIAEGIGLDRPIDISLLYYFPVQEEEFFDLVVL